MKSLVLILSEPIRRGYSFPRLARACFSAFYMADFSLGSEKSLYDSLRKFDNLLAGMFFNSVTIQQFTKPHLTPKESNRIQCFQGGSGIVLFFLSFRRR